jgi:hypothetical protein
MSHLVLLGDSVLDNKAYTAGGPPIVNQIKSRLPKNWKVSLLAVDGSLIEQMLFQIKNIPADASHLVISIGGNNALMQSGFVSEPARSVAEVFMRMGVLQMEFEQAYRRMLDQVLERSLPTILCTIYYPNFADATVQALYKLGVMAFNDSILRAAVQNAIPVIDLRLVCTTPADYANEIEPSGAGGAKIAEVILRAATTHDFSSHQTSIYR